MMRGSRFVPPALLAATLAVAASGVSAQSTPASALDHRQVTLWHGWLAELLDGQPAAAEPIYARLQLEPVSGIDRVLAQARLVDIHRLRGDEAALDALLPQLAQLLGTEVDSLRARAAPPFELREALRSGDEARIATARAQFLATEAAPSLPTRPPSARTRGRVDAEDGDRLVLKVPLPNIRSRPSVTLARAIEITQLRLQGDRDGAARLEADLVDRLRNLGGLALSPASSIPPDQGASAAFLEKAMQALRAAAALSSLPPRQAKVLGDAADRLEQMSATDPKTAAAWAATELPWDLRP